MKRLLEKLGGGIPLSDRRWLGLKIAFVGWVIGMLGGMLMFVGVFKEIGYWLFVMAMLIFIIGAIFHFPVVLRSMRTPTEKK